MNEERYKALIDEIKLELHELQKKSVVVEFILSPEFYYELCQSASQSFRTVLGIPVSVSSFLPKSIRLRFLMTNGSVHDWHGNEAAAA